MVKFKWGALEVCSRLHACRCRHHPFSSGWATIGTVGRGGCGARRTCGTGAGLRWRSPHIPRPPQVFKFTLYLSIPVSLTVGFVYNPERLERLTKAVRTVRVWSVVPPARILTAKPPIAQYGYVNYPPAGPPPPTLEEIKAMLAQEKKNKAILEKKAKKGWLW